MENIEKLKTNYGQLYQSDKFKIYKNRNGSQAERLFYFFKENGCPVLTRQDLSEIVGDDIPYSSILRCISNLKDFGLIKILGTFKTGDSSRTFFRLSTELSEFPKNTFNDWCLTKEKENQIQKHIKKITHALLNYEMDITDKMSISKRFALYWEAVGMDDDFINDDEWGFIEIEVFLKKLETEAMLFSPKAKIFKRKN